MAELSSISDYVKKLCQDVQHHEQQLAEVRGQMEELRYALQQFSRTSQVRPVDPGFQAASVVSSVSPPATHCATLLSNAKKQVTRPSIGILSSDPPVMHSMAHLNFPVPMSTVRAEQQKSPAVRHILRLIREGCETTRNNYIVSAGLVYRTSQSCKPRLYVPSSLVTDVLQAHAQQHGHRGVFKTFRQLHAMAFWPRLWDTVKNFLKQTSENLHVNRSAPLRTAPVQYSALSRSAAALFQTSVHSDPIPTSDESEDEAEIMCYPG